MRPSCDPHATPKPPQCDPHATLVRPQSRPKAPEFLSAAVGVAMISGHKTGAVAEKPATWRLATPRPEDRLKPCQIKASHVSLSDIGAPGRSKCQGSNGAWLKGKSGEPGTLNLEP